MILPQSTRLIPMPDLRVVRNGEVLIGGTPTRLLRLTPSGAQVVQRWFEGAPVSHLEAHQGLARRLVDRGLAALECGLTTSDLRDVTIVMPVKDDLEGVVKTLNGLAHSPRLDTPMEASVATGETMLPVVVVDDGSSTPIRTSALRARIGQQDRLRTTVLRQYPSRGPGSARNHGLDAVDTKRVVFVDAGVVIDRQQVARLMSELDDSGTVAVAPRVVATAPLARDSLAGAKHRFVGVPGRAAGLIADYETRWSALDLGPRSGLVGPGRRLTYVPSTCLAVDTQAFHHVGGFDPDLRFGEDVDLGWRIADQGWVRYVADVIVSHPPRSSITDFARQRFQYGTAAGPLAVRHPENLSPVTLTPSAGVMWLALASGHPVGFAVAVAAAALTYRRLNDATKTVLPEQNLRHRLAGRLMVEALAGSGLGLATATARTWAPGLVAVGLAGKGRLVGRNIGILWTIGLLRRVRRTDPASAAIDTTLGFVDDLAYSTGVWVGARREATARPLLARLARSAIER